MKILVSTDNATGSRFLKYFAREPDDSLALAVLFQAHRNKEVEIVGVTSTFGNTDGETTYQITKKQVELSGLDIPVVKGATHPNQTDSPAIELITKTLEASKEKVILVGLGPVTDFAAVFKKFSDLKTKVDYFFLVRSGPYLAKKYWYLCSFNAIKDIRAANFMHQLGGNSFMMGNDIFQIGLDTNFIKELQRINHPMMKFITKDLVRWNWQNKIFPNKGYFLRKGNMCPWDLVWSVYLIEPDLYRVTTEGQIKVLHPKDTDQFLQKVKERLQKWASQK